MASLVASGGLAAAAQTAGAAPALVVDPSTDLVDRQEVQVDATGFSALTTFGAAQCDASLGPEAGTDACDLGTAFTTTTDESGAASFSMRVRRIITVQGREIDCAFEPCNIGVATLDGTTPIEALAAPITFDPDIPPVPALSLVLTVDDVSGSVATGTVTCNREADAFVDFVLDQDKGGQHRFAFGFTEEPIACSTTATEWTVSLTNVVGRLTGGAATYSVFGTALDGFDFASALATGEVQISGGPAPLLPVGEQPGETVRVEILGVSDGPDGLQVDLTVTCDRAVPEAFVFVRLSQLAGLEQTDAFGSVALGSCDGTSQVAVPLSNAGAIVGGPARVEAFVELHDSTDPEQEFFDLASAVAAVRVPGAQPPQEPDVVPDPGSRITITDVTRTSVSGFLDCEEPVEVELTAIAQQNRGRRVNQALGFQLLPCDGTTAFAVEFLVGDVGPGSGLVFVSAMALREVEGGFELVWEDQQAASLRIGS